MAGMSPAVPSFRKLAAKDADARNKPGMTISLRGFLLRAFVLRRCQDLYGPAGLLDRRDGRLRRAVDFDIQLGFNLAAAQQPNARLGAPDHAGFDQRLSV